MSIALAVLLMLCGSTIRGVLKEKGWKAMLLAAPFSGVAIVMAAEGVGQNLNLPSVFDQPVTAWRAWLLVVAMMLMSDLLISRILTRVNRKA